MKKSLLILGCLAAAAALVCSCGQSASKKAAEEAAAAAAQAEADSIALAQKTLKTQERLAAMPDEPVFDIVTNLGTIKIRLYSDTPKHRENFAKLAFDGFYDGVLFHRVINGFMIQGGDPLTKNPENEAKFGTGGPGYTVEAEFVAAHTHKKGALAAARQGDLVNPKKESSGSQFYIVQDEAACASLNGEYTVFGETIDGFKVIDDIAAVSVNTRNLPLSPVTIISVKYDEELNAKTE